MENKKIVLAALLAVLLLIIGINSWKIFIVLLLIAITIIIVDIGPEKLVTDARTFLLKKLSSVNIQNPQNCKDEKLTIHDVEVKALENGMYELSIYTEKGKLTLEPRQFSSIPEVLTKGKTVTYKEIYSLDGSIKKEKSISAIGSDGEERIFRIQ